MIDIVDNSKAAKKDSQRLPKVKWVLENGVSINSYWPGTKLLVLE